VVTDPRGGGSVRVPPPLQVQLTVAGRRCLVVGGGPVGVRRARTLVRSGAVVVLVAPRVHESLGSVSGAGRVEVEQREFDERDIEGCILVVTATGRPEVDARVAAAAAAAGVPVNRADDVASGDLAFPAVVHREPVSLAVSTAGRAPVVARWLAERLDDALDQLIGLGPEGYGVLVDVVEEVREELRLRRGVADAGGTGVTTGSVDWRNALDATILGLIDQGRRAEAKERLLACLSSS
jgi:siroheme synthase-like protein